MNRTSGVVSTGYILTVRTDSILRSSGGSGQYRLAPKGHVKYSGKAFHRLGQNEGLSPPVMFRSNLVVLSTWRRMSLPPDPLMTYSSHSIRTTSI